ncbi:ribonuclease H-like domain-containing protein [Gaertneriomyces semiglobifer]|nr:ribonuclease H-like domain-containing protein [Gaertneriomyces semiglobifer]
MSCARVALAIHRRWFSAKPSRFIAPRLDRQNLRGIGIAMAQVRQDADDQKSEKVRFNTDDPATALKQLHAYLISPDAKNGFPSSFQLQMRSHSNATDFVLDMASLELLKSWPIRQQRTILRGLKYTVETCNAQKHYPTLSKGEEPTADTLGSISSASPVQKRVKRLKETHLSNDVSPRSATTQRFLQLLADADQSPLLWILAEAFSINLGIPENRSLALALYHRLFELKAMSECAALVSLHGLYSHVDSTTLILGLVEREDKPSLAALIGTHEERLQQFYDLMESQCTMQLTPLNQELLDSRPVQRDQKLSRCASMSWHLIRRFGTDPDTKYPAIAAALRLRNATWLLGDVRERLLQSESYDSEAYEGFTDLLEVIINAGSSSVWNRLLAKYFVRYFIGHSKTEDYAADLAKALDVSDYYEVAVQNGCAMRSPRDFPGKKEALLPAYNTNNPIHFVGTVEQLRNLQSMFVKGEVARLAVDCEWSPTVGLQDATSRPAVLQIGLEALRHNGSREQMCHIIDLIGLPHDDLQSALQTIFLDTRSVKLGFDFGQDVKQLRQVFPSMPSLSKIPNFVDLQKTVSINGTYTEKRPPASLSSIAECFLNQRLDKSARLSNWERRPLRNAQLKYAANDSMVLLDIHAEYSRSQE